MQEQLIINYGQQIGIQNLRNKKYVSYDLTTELTTANTTHPFLNIKNSKAYTNMVNEFEIRNVLKEKYYGGILFGSGVYIQTKEGGYLTCSGSGELRIEKLKFEDKDNSIILKQSKWTILNANSTSSKDLVTVTDDIIFKSPYGNFLICELKNKVTGNGPSISPDTIWKIYRASIPFMPDWVVTRPFLNNNHLLGSGFKVDEVTTLLTGKYEERKSLGTMNIQMQEICLIDDILYVMMSIEGTYIKKKFDNVDKRRYTYAIEPYLENSTCESSLKQLAMKIFPLCYYHDRIEVFINTHSNFNYGTVSQALCAALKTLMREYILLINQLDSEFNKGELSLQKMWFFVQPSLKIMEALFKLLNEAENKKGGALLSEIYNLMSSSTDQQTLQIYFFLLSKSFVPYMDMLGKWIYQGVIDDIFEEFLISEQKEIKKDNINKDFKDDYWELRFKLREDQVPVFLAKQKEAILITGKYLNVIRESGKPIECPFSEDLINEYETLIQTQDFNQPISKANEWANRQILDLVLNECKFLQRLSSLKHYFCFDFGDLFIHFLDTADEELNKGYKTVSKEKLEILLEMAIRTSSANSDPYKDDVTCDLRPYTLIEEIFAMMNVTGNAESMLRPDSNVYTPAQNLKGIEMFTLDYKVRWPLNLILSRKCLTKYQLLFRHLLYCKYIERQLCNTWLLHQSTKEINLQRQLVSSYLLTHKMMHFSKSIVFNLSYEVIEQKWLKFESDLRNIVRFDDILTLHNTFLDGCLKESLLLNNTLLKQLSGLNSTCILFSRIIIKFQQNMNFDNSLNIEKDFKFEEKHTESVMSQFDQRKKKIKDDSQAIKNLIESQSHVRVTNSFDEKFQKDLKEFINQMRTQFGQHETYLINLLNLLDYEGLYKEKKKNGGFE